MFVVFVFFIAAEDTSQGTWSDLERHRRQHWTAIQQAQSAEARKGALADRNSWLRRQCWSLFQNSCFQAVFYAGWTFFGPEPEPEEQAWEDEAAEESESAEEAEAA